MQTYSIGAGIKFLIGLIIISVLYNYVNVYESPILGLSFGYLGLFMIVRGLMYFFFLGLYKLRSSETDHSKQSSFSYKLSLLFALFMMVNLTLMINNMRTNFRGIVTLLVFIGLIPVLAYSTNLENQA